MSKHRIVFDFTEEAFNELISLQVRTGLSSKAEVLRHSLAFLRNMLNETEKGATIILENGDSEREVIFPFWNKEI